MRIPILFLASLSLLLLACVSKDSALAEIEQLEEKVASNPSQAGVDSLLTAYRMYVDEHPEKAKTNAELLFKAAQLQVSRNKFSGAIDLLKEALRHYLDTPYGPRNTLLLAEIYRDNLNNPEGANAVYQAYIMAFPEHEYVQEVQDSLLADAPAISERIEYLRANIYNDSTNRIEYQVANDFIGVCEVYGLLLPDDPKTPAYLHEAGKTAGYIRSFNKAVELYEWIYEKYPESEKAPQSLFMLAFTYDNEMGDTAKARMLYEEFIEKYPDNDFFDDAQFLLSNLGKSDEEIIESFDQEGNAAEEVQ